MKKILFVYHTSNIGGGSYCLLNILKEIDKNKYIPIVVLRTEGALSNEIKSLGIDIYYMPYMTLYPYNRSLWRVSSIWELIKYYKARIELRKILDIIKPDAVYFNTMMLTPYLEIAKNEGYKTIIHLREHWPYNEHVNQLRWLQNKILKYADQVIAINKYSASLALNSEITIVYDWIDLSNRFKYLPFDEIFGEDTSKLKVYLFTGGLQKIKGAAEIVSFFKNRIKDENCRLLMVDVNLIPDKIGIKNKIKHLLAKVGYYTYQLKTINMIHSDKRIVCIPATYDIKHLFEQAYCFISFFTIPHANLALAENIIVGSIPVVAKTEESIEYSNGGELALLFEMGNQNDLYEKLKELDSNYNTIKSKIIKKGYIVKDKFSKERNVALLNNVIDKLFN